MGSFTEKEAAQKQWRGCSSTIGSQCRTLRRNSQIRGRVGGVCAQAQLLDSLFGTERGLAASSEVRAEINELITQLEAQNPNPSLLEVGPHCSQI